MFKKSTLITAAALTFLASNICVQGQPVAHKLISRHLTESWQKLPITGKPAATNLFRLAIGLPLQNTEELGAFMAQLYDPASTNYHRYLTTEEFTRRFGPTTDHYEAVAAFAASNGLHITARHPNRLVLDVEGQVMDVEKTFHVTLQTHRHPREARDFFAPDTEPTVDLIAPMLQVSGLNNYSIRRPKFQRVPAAVTANEITPRLGTGPTNTYIGKDFRNAYIPGMTNLTGAGQSVGLLQFDTYYTNDIARYCATGGITTSVTLSNVAINAVGTPGSGNGEVTLDIQMVLAMAPGVSKIYVYEATNPTPWVDLLSRMANDNAAKQLSCSWGDTDPAAPDLASEQIFIQMAAQGQSFFNASGDSDAFTNGIPFPSESTNITQVGGTTLTATTNAGIVTFSSETVWNWGISRSATTYDGVGSSGGISLNFGLPIWQQGMNANLTSAGGSLTKRNVPDVSLTADNVYNISDNGTSKGAVGGTSCAAPLWAGFMALVNQQAAANGGSPAGFINPAVYAIGNSVYFTNCFHDITTRSNSWSASPTKFRAVTGYDLATGWGTPNGTNLINALSLLSVAGPPQFVFSPASQTNYYGANASFSVLAGGAAPLSYQWYFTNAIPGATNASIFFTNLVATNSGNYFVIVTNAAGSATSAVATLTVVLVPAITQSPASQSVFIGQPANFSVTAFGAPTLTYQWRKNSNSIAGANATNYPIASVGAGDAGYYDVIITNSSGSVTSSVALLTAVNPASYNGVLAAWETTGLSGYGPSPFAATSNAPNVTVVGLTRGAGVNTVGTAGANAWGGTGFVFANESAAIAGNSFATFSLTATSGYLLSCSNIPAYNIRHSGTGSTTGIWQYSVGGSAFTDIGSAITWGSTTTSSGNGQPAIDLSGISALQNVPSGTNVTFRIVLWGGASPGSGSWYVNNLASGFDLQVLGSLSPGGPGNPPVITSQPASTNVLQGRGAAFTVGVTGNAPLLYQWSKNAVPLFAATNATLTFTNVSMFDAGNYSVVISNLYGFTNSSVAGLTVTNTFGLPVDNGPGFSNDENLYVTNISGGVCYVWSTTDASQPVSAWNFEGATVEFPVVGTGISRYGITVKPTTSPVYYIFAQTNTGPYTASEPFARLSTVDFSVFDVLATNAPISALGVFALLAPPVILLPPAPTNVFAGKNASLSVSASGTAPLNYQWRQGGVRIADGGAISGALTNALNFSPAATNHTGDYTVVITNLAGSVTSSVAQLTVVPLPTLTLSKGAGGVTVLANGAAVSNTVIVQRTTNLQSPIVWVPLQTNVIGADAQIRFTETNLNLSPAFYRIQIP
jgi:hypothetical protein